MRSRWRRGIREFIATAKLPVKLPVVAAELKDKLDPPDVHNFLFTASEAEAHFDETNFFIKKGKRPGDEIQVAKLPLELQKRWTQKGGARDKEWKKINVEGATRVWRGQQARTLAQQFPDRIIRSRWHEKGKDMGEEYNNGLDRNKYPDDRPCEEAKSRWILLGFEGPGISLLNRTVPTPATEDVPMGRQLMASLGAAVFTADVASAFGQNLKG